MNDAKVSQPYHHGNLRQALIDAAGEVLEDRGVDAISFRGLARDLNVSHAAPGHHFKDRNELLAELAADGYNGLAEAMATAMDGSDPAEWLERTGQAYIRFAVAHPQRYRMMFASGLMTDDDCPQRLTETASDAYMLLLTAAYPEGIPGDESTYRLGTPELAAWSIVHGAVMLWLDGQLGELSEEDFLALADRMLAERFG